MARTKILFSRKTPRAALPWPILTVIVFSTLAVLLLVWLITTSEWLQWLVMVSALFVWNFLLVRAGKSQRRQRVKKLSTRMSTALAICGVLLLTLSAGLVHLSQESSLYPGPKTISFIVVTLPIMIWANVHLRQTQVGSG
jgi:Flp pilus assembly protein TadB